MGGVALAVTDSMGIPPDVHVYHSLFPLEPPTAERLSKVFRVHTSIFKVTSSQDGLVYALRRVHGMAPSRNTNSDWCSTTTALIIPLCALDSFACLLAGFRLSNQMAMTAVEAWRRVNHPNIVTLREVFSSKQFGDSCTGMVRPAAVPRPSLTSIL